MFGMLNDLQAPIEQEKESEEGRLVYEMSRNIGVDIEQDTTNIFYEACNELYPGCSRFFSNFFCYVDACEGSKRLN